MSRYHSYLNSSKEILQQYKGEEPFSSFIKKFFSANKKYGSKDRKQISQLCYSFFRMGKAVMNVSLDEKILIALFLCTDQSSEMLKTFNPDWDEKIKLPTNEKLLIINYQLLINDIFPLKEELSEGIDFEKFCKSFFIQPDLFLRLRPGNEKLVKQKLESAGIEFKIITETCLSLPNTSKIDTILKLDKEIVIQDSSSQKTGELIKSAIENMKSEISLWDCCAGSGGKSVMAYDLNPKIILTVSDMRESILTILKKRFKKAGIENYKTVVIDLAGNNTQYSIFSKGVLSDNNPRLTDSVGQEFSIIIADVPCTGSGTWSRTPEQLYFFNENKISNYARLQKQIVSNVIPQLKPGGQFIYITCSVFKKENEEVAEYIEKKFKLRLVIKEIIQGYEKKADSMFVAVFNS